MFAPGSVSNPFEFNQSVLPGVYWTNGKTASDPRLIPGERTGVFVGVGQSMIANSENATYTPVHGSKIDNLSIYDGGVYVAKDPLLGAYLSQTVSALGGNWLLRFADKLIAANVFDRVILVPIAIGATSIADWAPGGAYNQRILSACAWCDFRGYQITAFLMQQGESDNILATPQAVYQSRLEQVIATPRAVGHNEPWLIGKSTYIQGTGTPTIRAAQAAVVNGVDIFAGADTDTLGDAYRQADKTHWNASGSDASSTLWTNAAIAAL